MNLITQTPFGEIAALLAMAAAIGFLGIVLRQPLIVSFIAVGLVAGPSALDLVRSGEQINLLSELGIAVLLFLVGIKLDIRLIRSLGAVALVTGLGQIVVTAGLGFAIGLLLGLDPVTSLYVAVALSFSSTIIIVKLLSDKREIDSLHGQIALGILIIQDIAVILAMIALSAIGIGAGHGHGQVPGGAAVIIGSGAAMVTLVVLFARHVATPLTEALARAPELLVIFAIALAAVVAAVGDAIGLGKELGGLLAGVALASSPYRETIAARLAPLRDFLLLFFFIGLGASLDLSLLGANLGTAAAFSVFILLAKPLVVIALTGALGYRKRTGFLAGLTLGQISEFSLIFMAMGVSLGHVGADALGLVTLVGLVTIAVSTYMITYAQLVYALFEPVLGIFERRGARGEIGEGAAGGAGGYDVVIFGLGRFGTAIGMRLRSRGLRVLGVDFNPIAVRRWRMLGLETEFGDAADAERVAALPLSGARWLVSAVPVLAPGLSQEDTRSTLIQVARAAGFTGRIAVTSHHTGETERLLAGGADVVLEPFQDAADRAADILSGGERFARTAIPGIASEEKAAS